MAISVGDTLGPYEILAPIGAGGMGEVWKARDTRLDRIVAIKTSSKHFSERFEREARAIAALNHPNICQIYDVGPDYLVMEYVEGPQITGPLPLALALKAAIQLASALEAAHRKSITHRDLKPANILTTKSGVKVLDFGLAKFELMKDAHGDETKTRALTQEGTIVGTLQYMAPEQLQGKPTDARSDIFSFGCVLYEILTGKRAFLAENQATLTAAIMDREPEPVAVHQPMIPPVLERVVKKCLAKDPDDRWQTASDLKSELQWVLDSGSEAAMPAPVVEHRRRHARLGWILAAVSTVLLAGFAIYHFRTAPAATSRFEVALPEGASWGNFDYPVVSPDGSRILFSATSRYATRSLWIRPIDSVSAQPLPGTEASALYPGAWSPDGRSIAYVADGKLCRLEMAGGSPQILSSATGSPGPPGVRPEPSCSRAKPPTRSFRFPPRVVRPNSWPRVPPTRDSTPAFCRTAVTFSTPPHHQRGWEPAWEISWPRSIPRRRSSSQREARRCSFRLPGCCTCAGRRWWHSRSTRANRRSPETRFRLPTR
jgi:serine/threonine protein kinase